MKYIMIMQFPMRDWKTTRLSLWPKKDVEAHLGFLTRFNRELVASGEFVRVEGLAEPEQAKIVRADSDDEPTVTDGPFPESKEFLAGFWVIDVETPERAVELAARASAAPGPGGKPLRMPIELRPVLQEMPV